MLDLLKNFSIENIILFIILLAFAVKEGLSVIDWFKERMNKNVINKNNLLATVEKHDKQIEQMKEFLEQMAKTLDILSKSDKDDIKSWIVEKHHYYCYERGYIDDQMMDCLERRYGHYLNEGGNSYIHTLMEELRKLPRNR